MRLGGRMRVHNLNVGVKLSVPRSKRNEIAREAIELAKRGDSNYQPEEMARAQGKLTHLARFHPREAKRLRAFIKPH